MATTVPAEAIEPPVARIVRDQVNKIRFFFGNRPVPPALWVKGQPLHLSDEIEFTLSIARTRWAWARKAAADAGRDVTAEELAYVVQALVDGDRFLRSYWGPDWAGLVSW